jgi:hypothetical protein
VLTIATRPVSCSRRPTTSSVRFSTCSLFACKSALIYKMSFK